MTIRRSVLVALALTATLSGQMEKREEGKFDDLAFASAQPAVGMPAPDLQLCDLLGRPRCIQALLGSTVVVVKGSYT